MDNLLACNELITYATGIVAALVTGVAIIADNKNYSTLIAGVRVSVSIIAAYAAATIALGSGIYMYSSYIYAYSGHVGEQTIKSFFTEYPWFISFYITLGILCSRTFMYAHQHQRKLQEADQKADSRVPVAKD